MDQPSETGGSREVTALWLSRLISGAQPHDLNSSQLLVLILLSEQRQPITVGRVAELVNLTVSVASRAITLLTDKGFAKNEMSTVDRRVREIYVTSAGMDLAGKLKQLQPLAEAT